MSSTLITKKNTCKILLLASLVVSSICASSGQQNDWDLIEDAENNITYYELRSDESVRYIVDTNDFGLKYLDSNFQAVIPMELGSVLQIEDLGLYGKVEKKTSVDGTKGICFSRQASMPSGSISVYNNYLHLVEKGGHRSRITYVFLSNTPCSKSFTVKGRFFIASRIEIDGVNNKLGKVYEIKVNLKQLIEVSKGVLRLNFDSRHLGWKNR